MELDSYINPADAVVVIDFNFLIKDFSPAASELLLYPSGSIKGKSFSDIFSILPEELFTLKRNTKKFNPEPFQLNMMGASGERVKVYARLIVLESLQLIVLFIQDAQKKTAVAEMNEEKKKLEAIFHSRSEGTFTIDKDWTITSFNRAAEKITGYDQQEAIGKKCWEIFHTKLCRNGCHMEYTTREKKVSAENELFIKNKNGMRVPIRVHSAPLLNANNEYIGGIETFRDISEIRELKQHLEERFRFENLVGRSKSMQKVYVLLENVAQTDSTVLITGESGTGKELVARAIHINSERENNPFVVVNCSAFAETLLESELFGHERGAFTGAVRSKPGHFELAQGGTLFLDEIGDITLPVQVKLLRVLETRQFERVGGTTPFHMNVRIIAATNRDLQRAIKSGRFREDLYYRINVFSIHLPPLRERKEDLSFLIEHFLAKMRFKFKKEIHGISSSVLDVFFRYTWPGNIRELENVLEHAFVMCHMKTIQLEHLPERILFPHIQDETPIYTHSVQSVERNLIQNTLDRYDGNRSKTAQALGMNPSTLWRKMKKFGLK